MKRLFSGIQPTGEIHIGNYLGAIKNWVELQDKYECIYCIVDMHAITIEYEVDEMQDMIIRCATDLIACGIDPDKSTLFVQSQVPEHTGTRKRKCRFGTIMGDSSAERALDSRT